MRLLIYCFVVVVLQHLAVASEDTCDAKYGLDVDNPGVSRSHIYEKNPFIHGKSGNYLIKTDRDGLSVTHCDMELENGWMKIADFDVTKEDRCPKEWRKVTVNNMYVCRAPSDAAGCYSLSKEPTIGRYVVW